VAHEQLCALRLRGEFQAQLLRGTKLQLEDVCSLSHLLGRLQDLQYDLSLEKQILSVMMELQLLPDSLLLNVDLSSLLVATLFGLKYGILNLEAPWGLLERARRGCVAQRRGKDGCESQLLESEKRWAVS
jgi:hypothetical protein